MVGKTVSSGSDGDIESSTESGSSKRREKFSDGSKI